MGVSVCVLWHKQWPWSPISGCCSLACGMNDLLMWHNLSSASHILSRIHGTSCANLLQAMTWDVCVYVCVCMYVCMYCRVCSGPLLNHSDRNLRVYENLEWSLHWRQWPVQTGHVTHTHVHRYVLTYSFSELEEI